MEFVDPTLNIEFTERMLPIEEMDATDKKLATLNADKMLKTPHTEKAETKLLRLLNSRRDRAGIQLTKSGASCDMVICLFLNIIFFIDRGASS